MKDSHSTVSMDSAAAARQPVISIRASSGNYLAALFAFTFAAGLVSQLGSTSAALALAVGAWLVIPFLAYTDRLTFDGKALCRRGPIALLARTVAGHETKLAVDEIESVVTIAVRTLRSAGRIYFRYRSEISSAGRRFTLISGGRRYRDLVRKLYPLIADAKMDMRSCELRDYLVEPQGIEVSLRLLNLASTSVLTNAIDLPRRSLRSKLQGRDQAADFRRAPETARGILLQRVANELRIAGRWRQAAEAFRRALLLLPGDARLLLEFGRFVRSQGNALRDNRLRRRAHAALRLSGWCSRENAPLLSRIAESCFEFGDTMRAESYFRQALTLEPNSYRAELGLAEIALREGKLAHVIHHYGAAAAIAPDEALQRVSQREIAYYRQLNQNDDYLSKELRRVSWLHNIVAGRRLTTRMTAAGLVLAFAGSFLEESVVVIGWAAATSSLIAWGILIAAGRLLSARRHWDESD